MVQDKRERHRLKRARKRKARSRHEAQTAQRAARKERAWEAADEAEDCFDQGAYTEAAAAAARAAAAAPGDRHIAALYVDAAERAGDLRLRRQALAHLCRFPDADVSALLTLAHLHLVTNDYASAAVLGAQARARFPRRMPERRRWWQLLEYVESQCARARPSSSARPEPKAGGRGSETLPLFPAVPTAPREPARRRAAGAAVEPVAGGERPQPFDSTQDRTGSPTASAAVAAKVEPGLLDIPVEVVVPIEGAEALSQPAWGSPEDVGLAILAAQIRDAESFDRLLSIEQARGLLRLSHQEETARKVLSAFLGRALLADEVGLGKTIEAGLVLSEYLLRGRVESALILAPPSLVGQWREELAAKFAIETRTTDDTAFRSDATAFWSQPGVVIASLATARGPRHRELVTTRRWDVLIVDEAHALKNARTESYALVSQVQSRFLLLLTATPIENRVEELYNLVSLIRPGQLGGRSVFVRRFSDTKGRVSEAARREVRALLGEVMIRNTRALSGVRLPPRFARTLLVEPGPAERELYGHLVTALRALGPGGRTRLLLSVLLQEAGSSPQAVRGTLEKIRSGAEVPAPVAQALAPAIQFAQQTLETSKGSALLQALDGADGSTVVFTRFRGTLDFLASVLDARAVAYERIDGDVPTAARHAAIARCRDGGGVLLSTDVGSEGLNLQFCRRIVNFDLPWNPMRIEQRIGRVHRIGQDHPVDVLTLCLAGSIEERILRILDERINLFELVVGEVEMILGYLEEAREFPDLVLEAFAEPESERREGSFQRIAEQLAAARARYGNVKAFDEAFFRNELGV